MEKGRTALYIDGMGAQGTGFRNFLIIGLAALTVLVAGCGKHEPPLNVIIIGIDTLRPDHLGCYGYERDTSPRIDELSMRGTLFEDALSQSPWTLTSFASVFTSLYPSQHGASAMDSRLRTDIPTLAMILLKRGYSTAAIVNAPFLRPEYKLDRGFEYYDYKPPFAGRIADGTTADALSWIDAHADEPFFVFVHYFDPHLPYSPPEPYRAQFYPDYAGNLPSSFSLDLYPRARATSFETLKALSPDDWDYIRALYDGEIRFTDKAVGELLEGIDAKGLRENTLVILLSDHGEEFFEHEGFEHGHTLYNELLNVALVMSLPGRIPEGKRVSGHVRLIDVAPTVLDFLGIERPRHFEGASVKPLITGDADVVTPDGGLLPSGMGYAEAMLYGTERKCILAYPWKYIYDIDTGGRLFFNLIDDPGENKNLADTRPEALGPVEEVLARTLFNISETYYIEMAGGGSEHVFDLELNCRGPSQQGSIYLAHMFDSEDRIVNMGSIPGSGATRSGITLRGLKITDKATIALKLESGNAPLEIDVRLDGETPIGKVYLGEALTNPESMPFAIVTRGRNRLRPGAPQARPDGPYFVIWKSGESLGGSSVIELGDNLKEELRSVGYLQ
jgi:arylsulfatase A-like enzyme